MCMQCQCDHMSPQRLFRHAILNGSPVPETARARLEAIGIDTYELENRLRQQLKGGEMI